jgi:hypothetical protein
VASSPEIYLRTLWMSVVTSQLSGVNYLCVGGASGWMMTSSWDPKLFLLAGDSPDNRGNNNQCTLVIPQPLPRAETRVKCPFLLSDLNQNWNLLTSFRKTAQCQIWKSVQPFSTCYRQTDRRGKQIGSSLQLLVADAHTDVVRPTFKMVVCIFSSWKLPIRFKRC